jgi:hypothetical protein
MQQRKLSFARGGHRVYDLALFGMWRSDYQDYGGQDHGTRKESSA